MPSSFFGQILQKKSKTEESEHYHRILPIRISLGTKFQLRQKF